MSNVREIGEKSVGGSGLALSTFAEYNSLWVTDRYKSMEEEGRPSGKRSVINE